MFGEINVQVSGAGRDFAASSKSDSRPGASRDPTPLEAGKAPGSQGPAQIQAARLALVHAKDDAASARHGRRPEVGVSTDASPGPKVKFRPQTPGEEPSIPFEAEGVPAPPRASSGPRLYAATGGFQSPPDRIGERVDLEV